MLESNLGLQKFRGQPPKTHPTEWFKRYGATDNLDGVCSDKSPLAGMPCSVDPKDPGHADTHCGGAPPIMGVCSKMSPAERDESCVSDDECIFGAKCVKPYCVVSFKPLKENNVYQAGKVNMGGCMGCHGIAQLNGYTFSFVSQDGQRGAGIDTEEPGQFDKAPTDPATLPTQ